MERVRDKRKMNNNINQRDIQLMFIICFSMSLCLILRVGSQILSHWMCFFIKDWKLEHWNFPCYSVIINEHEIERKKNLFAINKLLLALSSKCTHKRHIIIFSFFFYAFLTISHRLTKKKPISNNYEIYFLGEKIF